MKPQLNALLIFRNVDILIGAEIKLQRNVTKSTYFHFDDLTFCVKKADLLKPWRSFFLIGSRAVWLISSFSFIIFGVTLFLFYKKYHHPDNIIYCIGICFYTLLAIPVPYNPTNSLARIHFGMLLLYGLLAVIFINCYLISVLTKPYYEHQISTTDELIHYEYKLLIDTEFIALKDLGTDKVT